MKKDLEILKLKSELSINKIKKYMFIVLFVAEIVFLSLIALRYSGIKLDLFHPVSKKVAVVKIDEVITDELAENVCSAIDDIKKDKNFKALVVKMNSPGGSPSASAEIAEYLKDINKTLPVTMYVDEIAASGGYYIASAIKPIIANKNAIIGSIGVIMPQYDASELAKKLGIKENSLTAGKYKQPFSLLKAMTKENKEYIEKNLLKPAYENFLGDVAINRGIDKDKLKEYAEGKIFVASSREIRGVLVDQISNYFKVKSDLKERFGNNLSFITIYQKDRLPPFLKSFADYIIEKIEFKLK